MHWCFDSECILICFYVICFTWMESFFFLLEDNKSYSILFIRSYYFWRGSIHPWIHLTNFKANFFFWGGGEFVVSHMHTSPPHIKSHFLHDSHSSFDILLWLESTKSPWNQVTLFVQAVLFDAYALNEPKWIHSHAKIYLCSCRFHHICKRLYKYQFHFQFMNQHKQKNILWIYWHTV